MLFVCFFFFLDILVPFIFFKNFIYISYFYFYSIFHIFIPNINLFFRTFFFLLSFFLSSRLQHHFLYCYFSTFLSFIRSAASILLIMIKDMESFLFFPRIERKTCLIWFSGIHFQTPFPIEFRGKYKYELNVFEEEEYKPVVV